MISGIKRRLNYLHDDLSHLRKNIITSHTINHAISDCVQNEEHKAILYAMLQMGLKVIIDSRKVCVQNMYKYLNLIRPAQLDNLVRIGGNIDGGYVMLPPPPPLK